ncbi:hypothetical protein OUZ56_000709 [Daphnia magna]|uniref:Uncharacterized protein n=1 Tax=Daphnia magna TaxID=35525 RepID=A0ABR0A0I0_9CRUS|nr:hypothetical protein OUZ56_000709 [Daphnia magna]
MPIFDYIFPSSFHVDVRGREDGGVLIGDEPSRGVTPAKREKNGNITFEKGKKKKKPACMYTCKAAQRDTTTHEKMFFTEDIFSLGPAAGVVRLRHALTPGKQRMLNRIYTIASWMRSSLLLVTSSNYLMCHIVIDVDGGRWLVFMLSVSLGSSSSYAQRVVTGVTHWVHIIHADG